MAIDGPSGEEVLYGFMTVAGVLIACALVVLFCLAVWGN